MDDIKLAGKTENIEPTWTILMEDVDLGEPTSFLDHENQGCTQRVCKIRNEIVATYRDMFESRIFAGAKEKLPTSASGNLMQKQYLLALMTWKVTQRNVWKGIANSNKTTQQLYKVATPCMDDHQLQEQENESVGELSTVCSQIVLKCLYLARIWETRKFVVCE